MEPIGYTTAASGSLREQGQVTRELAHLAGAVDGLHDALGALEVRTLPIRLGRPEAKAVSPDQPREVLAEIANELVVRREQIEQATRRVLVMLDELEL